MLNLTGAEAIAFYADDYYRNTPAVTRHSCGAGTAVYQACRDSGSLKAEILSGLIRELNIPSVLGNSGPLPHGVTAHSRTDGEHTYLFVENYSGQDPVTLSLPGEAEDLLGGGRTDRCALPPYGFAVYRL